MSARPPADPLILDECCVSVYLSVLFIFKQVTEINMIDHKSEITQERIVSNLLCNFLHLISLHSESEKTLRMTWISYCRGSQNSRFRVECWLLRLWSTAPWPSQSVQPVMDKHSWLELTMDKEELL